MVGYGPKDSNDMTTGFSPEEFKEYCDHTQKVKAFAEKLGIPKLIGKRVRIQKGQNDYFFEATLTKYRGGFLTLNDVSKHKDEITEEHIDFVYLLDWETRIEPLD